MDGNNVETLTDFCMRKIANIQNMSVEEIGDWAEHDLPTLSTCAELYGSGLLSPVSF